MTLDPLISIITVLGLGAFTLSGVIEAKRKDMDIVGAAAVAFITAVGGGTVRDVLLGRYPIFWISDQRYAIGIFALAAIAFYSLRSARITSSFTTSKPASTPSESRLRPISLAAADEDSTK